MRRRVDFGEPRLPERFWSKVVPCPMSGCWLWTASITRQGYGGFGIDGRVRGAHRVAYESLIGPVPRGLELDHLCRTRCCVNPAHLEPVTHAENIRRGAGPAVLSARYLARTECPAGHPYDEANTRISRAGWRRCRACHNARMRAWNAKEKNRA